MRILLVADIHANWPALAAIDEPFDRCLVLGDLVDYGPFPAECIAWVRRHATRAVKGNHDHGVAQDVRVVPNGHGGPTYKWLTAQTRPLNRARLAEADRRYLHELPTSAMVSLAGNRILMVHATPRDPLDEVAAPDPELWAKRLEGVEADIVCVGHTHQQYLLEVNGKLVINPGSVGLPREGDPRCAYAIVEDGKVHMHRIDYPVEVVCEAVNAAPLTEEAKAALCAVYRTGGLPR